MATRRNVPFYQPPFDQSGNGAVMDMIDPGEYEGQIAKLCHALGHPLRVGIVRYIAANPRCICNEIVVRTNRAQSTVSEHLRVLIQAGLVECEAEGQATLYWLAPEALRVLNSGLEKLSRPMVAGKKFPLN